MGINQISTQHKNIMKTLKAMMIGLAFLLVCGVASAAKPANHNSTKDEVIDAYLNAVVHGNLEGIDNAIDDDAQFNTVRGEHTNTLNKGQLIDYLKASAGAQQDCKCTATVVQDTDDIFIKKVDMNYGDFTRTDVITAQRVGNGWKITKVQTSFK